MTWAHLASSPLQSSAELQSSPSPPRSMIGLHRAKQLAENYRELKHALVQCRQDFLYLFLDMLGILSLKNKSITFCFLMTLLRLGDLGQKWRTHCQKIWFFVVRIVYKPKTKCASAIGRNKPTASLTTTQLHWKTNPWSIDHTAVLVYAKCFFNTQEIQNNTLPFVCLTCS